MKKSLFLNVFCNVLICLAIVSVAVFGLTNVGASTFGNGNSPIYKGNTDSSKVSLMLNVYQNADIVIDMLKVLEEYGVKITFFVGGSWVEKNIEVLKLIQLRGHEIGNHGFFHKDHSGLTKAQNYDEIYITHKLVYNLTGFDMTLFAPPSGAFSKETLSVANQLGYKTIMWSKDTIDWRDQDLSLIVKRATHGISGGDLILMHPTECTLKALPEILTFYREKGFEVVPVSQNIYS